MFFLGKCVWTAANAANASDVPTECAAKHNRDEVLDSKFRNLNFLPFTIKTTEYSFELFLFLKFKPRHFRTIGLLNKLRPLKKLLFQTRRWSCDFPLAKTLVKQKHCAVSRQEKIAFSSLRRVGLGSPPPKSIRTDVRAYADVTTKMSRIDRFPDLLTHGATLAHFARWSSAMKFSSKLK